MVEGWAKLYSVPNRILNNAANQEEEEDKNWHLTTRCRQGNLEVEGENKFR